MEVADYLQNEKRVAVTQIEQQSNKRIVIHGKSDYTGEKYSFTCYDERGTVEQ
jgi:Ribonuclease G/E